MYENTADASRPWTLVSFPNAVVHVDCNAFFTSVEQALDPSLKGKPVITGKERGIVACASYEAKALGIKRPMRLWDARKICPQLVCLPSDYETYSLYSKRMFEILRRFTPAVEESSMDEGFANLTGMRRVHHKGYAEIAWDMKSAIQRELGLTVSLGLGVTKTLAKIISAEKKPDGFTVVRARELHTYLAGVAAGRVCGLGPNSVALLKKYGVHTALDYALRPEAWTKKLLGKTGVELWHELRGEWVYPLVTEEKHDYGSISKCKTFTPPSSDKNFVRAQLVRNIESAFIKMRRHKLRARGMAVFLREKDFSSEGVEALLDRSTSSTIEAARLGVQLFEKIFRPNTAYRLTGIALFKLESGQHSQYSLFDDVPRIESLKAVDKVIDEANRHYGKHSLRLGTGLWLAAHAQHLSERGDLPERKKQLLPGETARRRIGIPVWKIKV
ncbi:MAG TPA: DNA polymerase IV [Verrucomicrobiae bacterium]|nr:DNA polymerase IV [Verrucomicrobiae bacterium]